MLAKCTYYCARWPEADVPADSPIWMHYEIDRSADAVLRTIEIFEDGRVTRNGIDLEQRNGDHCPSLIDCSLSEGFDGVEMKPMSHAEFEALWAKGVDKPVWFA